MKKEWIKKSSFSLVFSLAVFSALTGCNQRKTAVKSGLTETKKISFFLTNDIHGHIEPTGLKNGKTVGGLSYLATLTEKIRNIPEYANNQAGFFILDSGDQFQGTLLSNYDEGKAIFKAMNEVGYDAVVPGNHDYDFGPIGWLFDRVAPGTTSNNPREVIEGLATLAKFPLLSANTYFKKSIKGPNGQDLTYELDSSCRPANQSTTDALDFSKAERPAFLAPYKIIEKAGVRVALIGLDNKFTATSTTVENVSDLCFRDEVDAYVDLRKQLADQADLFVILIHNGNSDNSRDASRITESILAKIPNGVDLVAAGHTHFIHNHQVDGIRVIQSGANGENFSRVDLFYDPIAKTVAKEKTKSWAGQQIDHDACNVSGDNQNAFICEQYPLPLTPQTAVQEIIAKLRTDIAPLAGRKILVARDNIGRNRIGESPMSNLLTDALRKSTQVDISFMNTGGIRTELSKGTVNYEKFFEVLPFANQVAIIKKAPWALIKKLLIKSIATCGRYGSLLFSGIRIEFSRYCAPSSDMDNGATLQKVETVGGEVLFDAASGKEIDPDRTFHIATLDFIAAGGSGYEEFKGVAVDSYPGLARDIIADQLEKDKTVATNEIDNRMKNNKAPLSNSPRGAIHTTSLNFY